MKFNRIFYDSQVNFKSISKKRIVLSILLGLISAIVLYSFYYVLRETDRMLFLDFEGRPTIISESDRYLYNLFFASISVILGNSVAISYLFSRPQHVFSRRNNKRTRILNDQAFLGPNFIYWFTKVWFLFGIFTSQFMGSEFIPNFMLPTILVVIVLYLDSWKSLILVIKKQRWKIQLVHLFTLVILILVLSKINITDYKSYDENMLALNPTVDVPSSLYQIDDHPKYYYEDLVFKMNFLSKSEIGLFNSENEQIQLYELYSYINKWEEYVPEELQSKMSPKLRANKNIPIKYIKQFELKLLEFSHINIIYEVANKDETTSGFYNRQLKHRISPSLQDEIALISEGPPRIPILGFYKDYKFQDTLRLHVSNKIEIENHEVPLKMLPRALKNYINKSTIIEYVYDDSTTYQDYINVFSVHKTAVWELRVTENYDEIDSQYHRNQFSRDEELNKERSRIKEKYPINITERFE
jgi:hypothetical protein